MNTFGYLFILAGLLTVRQVMTGRVKETPADVRDLSLAFMRGDMDAVKTVLSQRGENVSVGSSEVATDPTETLQPTSEFAKVVVSLGEAAKGYRLGTTGPEYYDCSGLIWAASRKIGNTEGRFTTSTINRSRFFKRSSGTPKEGDVLVWTGRHMGVSLGGDKLYSARSVSKGIGPSTVSGDSGYFGYEPLIYRIANDG